MLFLKDIQSDFFFMYQILYVEEGEEEEVCQPIKVVRNRVSLSVNYKVSADDKNKL